MTEPAPARPRFTRRRVLLGAMALVLGLAVAGFVFGVFDGDLTTPVKVTFLRFEKASDGRNTVAVLKLENESNRIFSFATLGDSVTVVGEFHSESSNVTLVQMTEPRNDKMPARMITPRSSVTAKIRLPEDGGQGRIVVPLSRWSKRPPDFLKNWPLVRKLYPSESWQDAWAWCDEKIQCPRVLPDGTVEPPRLLPKGESKTQ